MEFLSHFLRPCYIKGATAKTNSYSMNLLTSNQLRIVFPIVWGLTISVMRPKSPTARKITATQYHKLSEYRIPTYLSISHRFNFR